MIQNDKKYKVVMFGDDGEPEKSFEAYGREIFKPRYSAGGAADELNTICNLLDNCALRMDKLAHDRRVTWEVAAQLHTYARLLSNISLDFLSANS